MAPRDDDEDERSIPLLGREEASSPYDAVHVPIKRAHPSSPFRFVLATALLVLGGLAAFLAWTHGRPAYHKYSRHLKAWNPHAKQLYFSNGTGAAETELVRSLYGPENDNGVDTFDLVATIYHKTHNYGNYGRGDPRSSYHSDSDSGSDGESDEALNATTTMEARAPLSSGITLTNAHWSDDGEGWTPPPQPEWQRLFSEPVVLGLKVSQSTNAIVKVVLPGSVV